MIKAIVNNQTEFTIEKQTDRLLVNGNETSIDISEQGHLMHVLHNNKSYRTEIVSHDAAAKTFRIKVNGHLHEVVLKDQFDELLHQLGLDKLQTKVVKDIKAPMPGLVVDVLVIAGQEIKEGDSIVILEAMKMENVLKAPANAIVKSVKTKKGMKVEKNEVLVYLE